MAADPSPELDVETIVRHVLPQKVDAVSYGLSILHRDVQAIRLTQADHGLVLGDLAGRMDGLHRRMDGVASRIDAVAETQQEQAGTLATHGDALTSLQASMAEVLRRLPRPDDSEPDTSGT